MKKVLMLAMLPLMSVVSCNKSPNAPDIVMKGVQVAAADWRVIYTRGTALRVVANGIDTTLITTGGTSAITNIFQVPVGTVLDITTAIYSNSTIEPMISVAVEGDSAIHIESFDTTEFFGMWSYQHTVQ